MDATRFLVVVADDYGIGPETSRGILELAAQGVVTAAVLLVNSPSAADDVKAWRQSGVPLELGWHPCLTMDPPTAPPGRVSSLLGPDGCLGPLSRFVRRLALGLIRAEHIEAELIAQYDRFVDLVGTPPTLVNSHQHASVFPPVGRILRSVLRRSRPLPYVRRVREPWEMLARVPGARVKRAGLSLLGRLEARGLDREGFPGPDCVAGITDPACVGDPDYLVRWLRCVPGRVVELVCHPGHHDLTLIGRDCTASDGRLRRRVDELRRLGESSFAEACRQAGFRRVAPAELGAPWSRGASHVA